jgi:hypothetical protein
LYASLTGMTTQDASWNVGDVNAAISFSLAAILCLVVGMWVGQLRAQVSVLEMRLEAARWSPKSAFFFYLSTLALSSLLIEAGSIYQGLWQPFLAASRVEWVGVFVLTYVCLARRQGLAYLLVVAGFEILKGFGGFFADFKEVFVVLLVGCIGATTKIRLSTVVVGSMLIGCALTLGIFWSAIKTDYRGYIAQGSWEQTAIVPVEDRLTYLTYRMMEFDESLFRVGMSELLQRLSYVDFLAATMRNVPTSRPFENGALVGATVMHVLQPRLLFPDKPPLPSDTDIAVRYSGLGLDAGNNAVNTSISLGYVAELYVDFGIAGTLAAMLLLGFTFGRSVRYVLSTDKLPTIVNYGLALMLMMSAASFEEALSKMVGGFITAFAVILLLRRLLPYVLNWWGPAAAAADQMDEAVRRRVQTFV